VIHHGDLFDVLPTLAADSIDAGVMDPPYDLTSKKKGGSGVASLNTNSPAGRSRIGTGNGTGGFMGMKWDGTGIAFKVETWVEIKRVLKPGAYLLAFGGTRTYHRMAVAIEDAGFEIRDSILYWGFGQGFPKSLDVNKDDRFCQCSEERGEHGAAPVPSVRAAVDADEPVSSDSEPNLLAALREELIVPAETEAGGEQRQVLDLRQSIPQAAESPESSEGAGETRAQGSSGVDGRQRRPVHGGATECCGARRGSLVSTEDVGSTQPGVEGRRDVLPEARQLQADQVRPMPGSVSADGPQRRVRNGASPNHGDVDAPPADENGSGSSSGPRSAEQRSPEPRTVAGQPEPQTGRRWPVCSRCGKSVIPSGLGTALKPAYEPIVVARKPFLGSVAQNVEQHGTAALNIDDCRIDTTDDVPVFHSTGGRKFEQPDSQPDRRNQQIGTHDLGRWPANVVIDDIAAAAIDEQTGNLTSGANPTRRGSDKFRDTYGVFKGQEECDAARGIDIGGASRFYYCAKPSREERDMGCYDVAPQQRDDSRKDVNPGGDNPRNRGVQRRGNFHPTVKPVELMRWLVRLVTPIGGTVLDPFTGSGTTGMACVYEQRQFIGIEREAEYVEIAKRRIHQVAPLFTEAV
jgi:DNA modification methylase